MSSTRAASTPVRSLPAAQWKTRGRLAGSASSPSASTRDCPADVEIPEVALGEVLAGRGRRGHRPLPPPSRITDRCWKAIGSGPAAPGPVRPSSADGAQVDDGGQTQ